MTDRPQEVSRNNHPDTYSSIAANMWTEKNMQGLNKHSARGDQAGQTLDLSKDIYGSNDLIALNPMSAKTAGIKIPETLSSKNSSDAHKTEDHGGLKCLEDGIKSITDYISKVQKVGSYHEISSPAQAIIGELRSILNDPNRDKGEFEFAIGSKSNKFYESGRHFTPSTEKINGYELHPALGSLEMMTNGTKIISPVHSHPYEKDADPWHFSNTDKDQAEFLHAQNPNVPIRAFLLTPNPKNQVLIYNAGDKANPNGEEVGHFENGNFIVTNDKYKKEFGTTH